ncbi:hypothetical protein CTAYLR_009092 [Chrysophaeum taylorii]|uniref:Uncharacterized protein n=1 Tax=Chrysophaeum taylorii TaxID=2483200 RepID=A0AAD7UJL0_9STRA|nr:hypothetical protein CTAYLR_009092 [Chrysophaeum taylorii]
MTSVDLPREATWGSTIQKYDADRRTACWGSGAMPPKDRRVSHFEKRTSLNPLLGFHFDRTNEERARDAEAASVAARVAAARTKQSAFDIVTHRHRRQLAPPKAAAAAAAGGAALASARWRTTASRNIISHAAEPTKPSGHAARLGEGIAPHSWHRRDYDIVSNKYGDERRRREDAIKARHDAERKFWKTHDYDPLVGRYYDPAKEAEFSRQRDAFSAIAGSSALARLPPAVQYSEGKAYDILSHAVKDQAKVAIAAGVGNRAVAGKKNPTVERAVKAEVEARDARDQNRALARLAKTVHLREREAGRHHGYDVLTGISHHARPVPPLAVPRPKSNLDQLKHSAGLLLPGDHHHHHNNNNNNKETGEPATSSSRKRFVPALNLEQVPSFL